MNMNNDRETNPSQSVIRNRLRTIGPILIGIGVLLMLIGLASFFSSFGSGEPPRYFWCCFLGAPILFAGIVLSSFGFMGAIARYQAGEAMPVAAEAFNYAANETKDGVKTIAQAVGEGISVAAGNIGRDVMVRCHKCHHENSSSAKFCEECGAALLKSKACGQCGESNDPDAQFCDHCGHQFE